MKQLPKKAYIHKVSTIRQQQNGQNKNKLLHWHNSSVAKHEKVYTHSVCSQYIANMKSAGKGIQTEMDRLPDIKHPISREQSIKIFPNYLKPLCNVSFNNLILSAFGMVTKSICFSDWMIASGISSTIFRDLLQAQTLQTSICLWFRLPVKTVNRICQIGIKHSLIARQCIEILETNWYVLND